ncbi:ligand-binding sensor domain-containing protein, partial [Aliarcobacter faecis]
KPLRPTRAFRNAKETSQIEEETLLTYQVYTHTFAYLYITQENIIKEYKVAYKGQAYNETFLDIYFIDENNHKLDFIPIEKDSEIKISYSNFKLNITKDKSIIDKLDKTTIKPSNIGNIKEKAFYSTEASRLNFKSLDIKEPIFKSYSNHKPDLKSDKNINIFCVIDDILGEIEDRYFELEDSFKYAYKLNNSYISKVQEINSYPVTITSILDYFYLKEKDEKLLEELEEKYKRVVEIYLTDETIIKNIFVKDNGKLDWIFEKDEFDTGLAYILKFKQIKYSLFEEFEINPANKNPSTYYKIDKNRFQAVGYNFSYHTRNSKDYLKSTIFLDNSDSKFTLIKDNANELLASVIFATIFSEKFDELLNNEILNLAKEIDKILQKLKPTPYLNDDKKEDLKAEINKNEIYKEVLSLEENNGKDSYLDDYARLDLVCRKNSFTQEGKIVKELFKSNYLHFPTKEQSNDKENSLLSKLFGFSQGNEIEFYKKAKDNNEFRVPKEILDEIKALLVSAELKYILNTYKEIEYEKDEEKLSYILGLKNIVHLLCASRLNIDEEQEVNNIFSSELKHILEFEEYIIEQIKTLDEDTIVKKITDYKINQAHSYLLQKSYIFAMLKGKEFRANAEKFEKTYKKEASKIEKEIDKQNEPKLHRFAEVEKIKIMKESFEFIKNVEGITSKVEEALDKVLKDEQSKTKHETILKYQASLKNFSNVFAVLKVVDFLIDEKDKKLIDYANFANDTIVLFKIVNSVLKISN